MGKEDYEEKAKHHDNAEKAREAKEKLEQVDGEVLDGRTKKRLEEAKESAEYVEVVEEDNADTS